MTLIVEIIIFWMMQAEIRPMVILMNIVTVVFIKVPIGKERVGIGMPNIKF